MRIAIVINTSWNIFNYRKGLIKAFLERGYEVIAIAPEDGFSSKLKELGCTYVNVSMDNKGLNPFKDLLLLVKLLQTYSTYKPDYVLHYTIKPNIFGSLACAFLGIKCISNVSGLGTVFIRRGWVFTLVKQLYKTAFTIPQKVFFQNTDDMKLFLELDLLKKNKAGLLPGSGINTLEYKPQFYSKHKPFRFLLVARLLQDKGIEEYADASRILKENGYEVECSLVGFFDRESKYNISKDDLENWTAKNYLRFLGESKDISVQIQEADCILLPSYREGTPRSLLEGMALAKPIIATNVPGCKEVVSDGENGFVCEPRSAPSLANTMERMLNLTEAELREMGLNGRKLAETKFDEKIVIQSYLNEII